MNYEAILAAEGLAPLEQDGLHWRNRRWPTWRANREAAVGLWQSWALSVLNTTTFRSTRHRHIWRLYATGKTYAQIQAAVGGSRRSVSWAIALIESGAPAKPCSNPWRQDLRGHAPARDPRIAWYDARRRRRASRGETEDESMAQNPTVQYSRILLARGDELEFKNRPGRRPTNFLLNVTGRPVMGGIEVYGQTVKGGGEDSYEAFPEAIMIPWGRIKQTERAQPEGEK